MTTQKETTPKGGSLDTIYRRGCSVVELLHQSICGAMTAYYTHSLSNSANPIAFINALVSPMRCESWPEMWPTFKKALIQAMSVPLLILVICTEPFGLCLTQKVMPNLFGRRRES